MTLPYTCCNAMRTRPAISGHDDRYGLPGNYSVMRCANCGHAQIANPPEETSLAELYTERYPRSRHSAITYKPFSPPGPLRGWLEGALSAAALWVEPGSRVLEIGCGACEMLGYLRSRGCDVVGTEIDQNVAAIAARQDFDVRIGPYNADQFPESHFDSVLLSQVIEHIPSPDTLLAGLNRNLRSGGHLIVTTPNVSGLMPLVFGRRWLHWHLPYHRHFFSPRSLALLAERTGFTVTMMRTITPASWAQYQWCHLYKMPETGTAHPFWNDTLPRPLLQRLWWRTVTLALHASYIDHLVYRLLDAMHFGDNLVAILRKN